MVDPDPGYRPKRAFVDPSPADDQPTGGPTPPDAAATEQATEPTPAADPEPTTERPAPAPSGSTAVPAAAAPAVTEPPGEDDPKPLYRDDVAPTPGAGAAAPRDEETRIVRPLNFRQRQRRTPDDEDATTLLPRTAAGGRTPVRDELDLDEDHPHRLLGRRGRLALLIGAVAAVVVVGAAIIFAVASVGKPSAQPSGSTGTGAASTSASGGPTGDTGGLLAAEQLLTPAAAKQIDGDRSWKIAVTQRPPGENAPLPSCLTNQPAEGEPAAQQKVVQVLTSGDAKAPSVLHQASAYASPEDAAQAYAVAARTFGGCVAPGSYIASGAAVTGLGDQAAGLVVNVIAAGKTSLHSVVLSRTGTVLNIADAVQPDKALAVTGVAKALGAVTATQCQAAGGKCDASPAVKAAPPPLGGDVPGFLATGDLPPAGQADESWVATPVDRPSEDFLGSQCETVNWSRADAASASTRVYLVASSTKFGLNDIVLTMKSEKAATNLVAKIKSDLDKCSDRKLTAAVSSPAQVEGVGAQGATVTGWTSTVSQKSTNGTQRYRVGIVSSGQKVAYTFLNPLSGGYDLTQDEWDMVAVRAGQRMTQVP
jgi:hypothetical protein